MGLTANTTFVPFISVAVEIVKFAPAALVTRKFAVLVAVARLMISENATEIEVVLSRVAERRAGGVVSPTTVSRALVLRTPPELLLAPTLKSFPFQLRGVALMIYRAFVPPGIGCLLYTSPSPRDS